MKYYNLKLKKKTDFYLGSFSENARRSVSDLRESLSQICTYFNGIRADLCAIDSRIKDYESSVGDLLANVRDILGCEITHIIDDLEFENKNVESDEEFLKSLSKINDIENPFVRLKKMADLDGQLEASMESFKSKADAIHERLRLSDGVQSDENVTAHKMLEKMEFVIDGINKRKNRLTSLRSRLYENLKRKLNENKPEIHYTKD